jgi:hypothetical protein
MAKTADFMGGLLMGFLSSAMAVPARFYSFNFHVDSHLNSALRGKNEAGKGFLPEAGCEGLRCAKNRIHGFPQVRTAPADNWCRACDPIFHAA